MHLLRALLWTDPLIILATVFFGSISLVASLIDASGAAAHRVARIWSRLLLWVSGVRVSVEGLENIPRNGGCVIAANHLSFMDTPVVLAHIPLQFRFLAKQSLYKVPFIGGHLRRAGHIPVPREDARGSLKAMSEAARIIRERGVSVLIFPEGGRSADGTLQPFKEGAAYIAIKAQAPLVPVALIGTREILPMGSILVRPGRVTVRIGAPMPVGGLTLQDRSRLTAEVRQRIVALMG